MFRIYAINDDDDDDDDTVYRLKHVVYN